ncbi:LiaF domain-containing protein [Lachnoclostridium sp.]|uniref:LiaF domain-containing protein n=1 Tax=Lachnoclostridium sp. TaxID=2028282 RepID=UPI0028A22B54|nr:LiaF domain-containing protein [Lachnoclostridium sp.]
MSKKKEIVPVLPKKKSKGKTVVKVIVAVAAIQGILKMVAFYKNKKNEKQPENEGTKKYAVWMNGKQVRLDEEELRSIEIQAVMSGIDIDLTKAKIHEDMFISGKAIMSGVCIRVPEDINVKMNCKTILGACANSVPKYFDETLPTIFVEVDGVMSGIAVKIGNTNEIENDECDLDKEDSE